ncbi:serine/threonine-protein kinase ATR isoform X1 [Cinnamomum micranthum f. kanehirae]|uniref:Serine/threonine-protein kinase ATR isoform X1 n=1 Tax=Cinnamomum micranthum f. kanehirae TaxID=337451 RepID=A0A3S3MXD2_9MAGN|nr:serine/threonine-protein kinase ATR isoform X1 [Cinnamomum micranthum f. kanehirae]
MPQARLQNQPHLELRGLGESTSHDVYGSVTEPAHQSFAASVRAPARMPQARLQNQPHLELRGSVRAPARMPQARLQNQPHLELRGLGESTSPNASGSVIEPAPSRASRPRGIDYAVTHNEVPPTTRDLPSLIKQGSKLATLSRPDNIIEVLLSNYMHAFGIPIERFVPTEDNDSVAVFSTTAGDKPSNEKERSCKLMTWSQEVVVIGRAHIWNGTQRIHCKVLLEHAYKVTVDVINTGDVALPYPDGVSLFKLPPRLGVGTKLKTENLLELLALALYDEAEEVKAEAIISMPVIILCSGHGLLADMFKRVDCDFVLVYVSTLLTLSHIPFHSLNIRSPSIALSPFTARFSHPKIVDNHNLQFIATALSPQKTRSCSTAAIDWRDLTEQLSSST